MKYNYLRRTIHLLNLTFENALGYLIVFAPDFGDILGDGNYIMYYSL